MNRSKVILVACPDYEPRTVARALERIKELCAQAAIAIPSGEQLVLKPNLLAAEPPEKAVTTHPEVFFAVGDLLKERGNSLCYGDSPGAGTIEKVARVTGMDDAARRLGIPRIDFETPHMRAFPQGHCCRLFPVAAALSSAGRIINLPKMKTHGQMLFTGAIKNMFGCVSGTHKPEFHFKMRTPDAFARLIVDVYRMMDPVFTVMDAVVAMEGNGPRGGHARQVGVLIAGTDALAIDAVACRIAGIDPARVPVLSAAAAAGLGSLDSCEIIGDPIEPFILGDFVPVRDALSLEGLPPIAARLLRGVLLHRPAVTHDRCTRCGNCVRECPTSPKSISLASGRIRFTYAACIRCFCCQEVCPEGAIRVQERPLARLLRVLIGAVTRR